MKYEICHPIIERHRAPFLIMHSVSQFDHRSMVLRTVAELEYEFKLYLLSALKLINPDITEIEFENGGIFAEPKSLSSLSKCLQLARPLALLNEIELKDFKKIVELRNMYAHGRDRQQLNEDMKARSVLFTMTIVENSRVQLENMNEQQVYLSCIDSLTEIIRSKKANFLS